MSLIPKITGVKNLLHHYKDVVKSMKRHGDPVVILNRDRPECVLMSVDKYEEMVRLINKEHSGWLKLSQSAMKFWDNEDDSVYDSL